MRFAYLLVAGTALVSASALAITPADKQSQNEQQSQQSSQTSTPTSQPQSAQSSEVVKQAQEKLSAMGHNAGPVDGIAGPKTKAAVKEFQQSKGLPVSGRLDTMTLAALDTSTQSSSSAPSPSELNSSQSSSDSSAPQSSTEGGSEAKASQ